MCLNPVNEEFDRAYANVGLLASDVWSFHEDLADYKIANLNLWVRFNEVEQRLIEDESDDGQSTSTEEVRTVQDTIPFSRLASYNDFAYNEERERMYFSDDEPAQYIQNSIQTGLRDLEVWMLPEVEEEFKRLTHVSSSRWCSASPRIPTGRELEPLQQLTLASPYEWLTKTSWPDQLLSRYPDLTRALQESSRRLSFFKEDVLPLSYDAAELQEKLEEFPCPRYLIETNADLELHTRIDSPAVRHLWTQQQFLYDGFSQSFDLNADVPEFQPVTVRQQQYPCIYDTSYEADLFPYIHSAETPHFQLQQQAPSPSIHSDEDHPVQNIPVFLRPPESYFIVEPCWRRHHGAVLSNLVPLTGPEQFTAGSSEPEIEPCTIVAALSAQYSRELNTNKIPNTEKMITFLDKWLTKIYNPRSSDFSAMSSTSYRIDKIFEHVQDNYRLTQEAPGVSPPSNSQRPLYSDVLMSDTSVGRGKVVTCNVSSCEKFEQLEKEALEQYSGSDTALCYQLPPPPPQEIEQLVSKHQFQTSSEKSKPSSSTLYQGFKQQARDDPSSRQLFCSPRSAKPYSSPSPGSKRSSNEEAFQNTCSPNKQAMWMKKKKKKQEKKKKITKQKKKPMFEHSKKFTESELVLISKFEKLLSLFSKSFNENEWKLVETLLTKEVKIKFYNCLKMIKELSEWLKVLIVTNELKEDYRANKKRLEIADSVVATLHKLLSTLHQYVYYYSKIKVTIPFDHRLYFDLGTLKVQIPMIICIHQGMAGQPSILSVEEFFLISGLFLTKFNVKFVPKLLNCSPLQRTLGFNNKNEWKLSINHDMIVIKKYYCLHLDSRKDYFRLVLDCEKERTMSVSHKLVKVVDDVPPWNGLQWKFVDGWKFDKEEHNNLVWLNQFNVDSLENVASSACIFIIYDWLFDLIDAATLARNHPKYEPFWNIRKPNLISCKMMFMKTLLSREEGWCFGDVRVNKQPCLPWLMGCGNSCCISWMLNHSSNTTKGRHARKISSQKTVGHRQKREEVKTDRSNVKSRISVLDKLSPEKQLILDKIASGEIILPQEKPELGQHSICSVQ